MFSINGTGVRYIGVKKTDQAGERTATLWISFFFLPIIPLRRLIIKPLRLQPFRMDCQIIKKTPLNWSEIFLSYLFGWIVIPIAGLAPMVLAIHEIQVMLGIPSFLETPIILLAIAWLIIFVWKIRTWDMERWFK